MDLPTTTISTAKEYASLVDEQDERPNRERKLGSSMASEGENLHSQICTLVYRDRSDWASSGETGTALLIARWENSKGLTLFVNPRWREFVAAKDTEYVVELLEDLRNRRNSDPENLFHQLCSLELGPVVLRSVRELRPEISEGIPTDFVDLA